MSIKKEEILKKIDDEDLLRLAKSVLDDSAKSETGRSELTKMVKNSLSVDETEKRIRELKNGAKISGRVDAAALGQTFRGQRLLKASIVALFAGIIMVAVSQGIYSIGGSYINSLNPATPMQTIIDMTRALTEAYDAGLAISLVVRTIGLALLAYWLFSSAVRMSSVNYTIAGILALAGSIMIAGIFISVNISAPYLISPYIVY